MRIFKLGDLTYKYDKGAYWLLIFYHNIENKVEFFKNEEEALNCHMQDKYSILGYINSLGDTYKIGEKFEFLYETDKGKKYLRWKQTNFPLNEDESKVSDKVVAGFVNISCPSPVFTGLAKVTMATTYQGSTFIPALLDGEVRSNYWHFSIASYGVHSMFPNTIPTIPGSLMKDVALWLRVLKTGDMCETQCNKRKSNVLTLGII